MVDLSGPSTTRFCCTGGTAQLTVAAAHWLAAQGATLVGADADAGHAFAAV
ncbi:hypothetical protein [Cryptosporangium sp. NPDC048952]|uniref:hypothetical protein n=1 Tax=Cryptosporangium sp. NPDC048952 TaxID=3363961 RepID=UPI00371CFFF1